jgi:hypothetical protein
MARAPANTLPKVVAALDEALEQRDIWIAAMRRDGSSLREIARAAQLTPEGVQHVLRRKPKPAEGLHPERQLQRRAADARKLTLERAQLLVALRDDCSERELAELSGLSRTAVRYQLALAEAGEVPQIARARG